MGWRGLLLRAAIVTASWRPAEGEPRAIPAGPGRILEAATSVEVYSLDPMERRDGPAEGFHGWAVLGKVRVPGGAGAAGIVGSIREGVAKADKTSGCFMPRHALRATADDGRVVDLVLCFSCGWMEVHVGPTRLDLPIADVPRGRLNALLREAGVPLARDAE